ncbi:unnamed protein product [Paramecium sonneborni]|uniref:Tetratricopeptide repeat protein n=1 Tax=Paramecium sonneborni TaxID=65129 RepID=A0A8S1QKT6_9CILI|nr:unnamed protein product [Paramecium sonneborni]
MDNYFCRYDFHNGQIIQGYCLNSECTSQPQYCQQCLSHLHNQHLQDCKDRNYLAQLIQSSIDSQNDFQRDTKSKIQNLEYITQKKLDYSFQEMEKLKQMQNYFQQESYQNFKKDIHILKKYYQGVEQKKNSIYHHKLGDFLSQIDSFSQTLQIAQNDILQEQIEKNQIMAKQQYEKGLTLSSGQHYQKALECFNQAILLDSRKEEYYIAKSNQLLNLNDYRNAIQSCDIAIRMKPQSYLAYCNKGFALNRINLYEEARNCCEKAIQINPNSAQAFIIKGSHFYLQR